MALPFTPPLEPMLAALSSDVPDGSGWLYEPKWDGFRAIVFRDGDTVFVQSRELKPLGRYFPELEAPLRELLPARCVVDGEIVIARRAAPGAPTGLDFDALLQRIHPAASRVAMLAATTPASFIAWDLLAEGDEDLRDRPLAERRARLEAALAERPERRARLEAALAERPERRARLEAAVADIVTPVHVTPATMDRAIALDWFHRFEGAGLDGIVAKRLDDPYEPGRRSMVKVKHARTADCVVGGFRWHKDGPGVMVGSLLLGLHDAAGDLHHVGVASGFSRARRLALAADLEPLRLAPDAPHPWIPRDEAGEPVRYPGVQSRWSHGRSLDWEPIAPERVAEVGYDHLQGPRFRHATRLLRWRPDRSPANCRYDQLEETPPRELGEILGPVAAR